jgi:predicted DNA-binding protein YlxM (UPF0122 family)
MLTTKQVRYIKKMYSEGYNKIAIARKFNVARSTIYDIVEGNTWKDIEYIEPPELVITQELVERFERRISKQDGGCWLFPCLKLCYAFH